MHTLPEIGHVLYVLLECFKYISDISWPKNIVNCYVSVCLSLAIIKTITES